MFKFFKVLRNMYYFFSNVDVTIGKSSVILKSKDSVILHSEEGGILLHCPKSYMVINGKMTHLNPDMNLEAKVLDKVHKEDLEFDLEYSRLCSLYNHELITRAEFESEYRYLIEEYNQLYPNLKRKFSHLIGFDDTPL